jgi:pimeloyl-ACP methyl ester carboxylesterase
MKLFSRIIGEGKPLIILHGLFGQSDNWNSLAKQFAEQNYKTITVDLRNHGLSPHSDVWNYQAMSNDVIELIGDLNLENVTIIGHSMGGKVAMQAAIDYVELFSKLIVVDIAPKAYPLHHQIVLEALNAVDFSLIKSRKEAEVIMNEYISDYGTKQFLLKNIYWKESGELAWRFNLKTISENIAIVGEATPSERICNLPSLFIRGEKSTYILDSDFELIEKIFPTAKLETIADAGHWVHAEKPKDFFETVMRFLN